MTTTVRDLVADYVQSVGDGRLDHVAALLHPDLDFGGTTAAELHGAGAYLTALERLSPIIGRNDIRARSSSTATGPSWSTTSSPTLRSVPC